MRKLLFLLILAPAIAKAQSSQGPLSPSVAENTSCPFSYSSVQDYLPASNVFSTDDMYATASHCDCCDANTRCFETKGYGFDIPLTATIDGILAEVEKKATPGSMVQDNGVMLLKAGITTGSSYATPNNWPAADSYSTYGGPADLWGSSWLPSEINDSAFGLAFASISYTCFGNGTPAISYIDFVSVTVYYTDMATGVASFQSSNVPQMLITPNPVVNGNIHISLPANEERIKISITDVRGKMIEEKIVELHSADLNYLFNLPKGIYLLQVQGSSAFYVQKVIHE